MKNFLPIFFVLIALASGFVLGRIPVKRDLTINWPDQLGNELLLEREPWIKEAITYKAGSYEIAYPADSSIEKIWVVSINKRQFFTIAPDGISLALDFAKDFVSLSRPSNRGTFHNISYDILDKDGNIIGLAIDCDRDGDTEYKVVLGEPSINYVRINQQWYEQIRKDNKFYIKKDGQLFQTIREEHCGHYLE